MLAVHRDLAVTSVAELIAYAKANPGKLSYASGNTSGIVAGATLKHWTGIDMLHVPYKTVPQAINDVLAGRVPIIFTDLTPGLAHIQSGALRALAVTRLRRSRLLPDVPSLHEAGRHEFQRATPGPRCLRRPTRPRRSHRSSMPSCAGSLTIPKCGHGRARLVSKLFSSTPDELGEFVRVQLVEWTRMIKQAGIEPE